LLSGAGSCNHEKQDGQEKFVHQLTQKTRKPRKSIMNTPCKAGPMSSPAFTRNQVKAQGFCLAICSGMGGFDAVITEYSVAKRPGIVCGFAYKSCW
jgi:hypothetical protein